MLFAVETVPNEWSIKCRGKDTPNKADSGLLFICSQILIKCSVTLNVCPAVPRTELTQMEVSSGQGFQLKVKLLFFSKEEKQ